MQVLDPCCVSRKFYFDKHSPFVIYGDIRDVTYTQCDGRLLEVRHNQKMTMDAEYSLGQSSPNRTDRR